MTHKIMFFGEEREVPSFPDDYDVTRQYDRMDWRNGWVETTTRLTRDEAIDLLITYGPKKNELEKMERDFEPCWTVIVSVYPPISLRVLTSRQARNAY